MCAAKHLLSLQLLHLANLRSVTMASGSCRSGRRRVEPPPHGLMVLVALAVVLGGALAYNTPAAGEAVSQHAMMKGGCLKYVAQVQGPVGRSAAGGGSGADGGRQQRELSATVGLGGNGTATSNDTTNATTSQYAAAGAKGTVDETIIDDATGLSRLSFRLRNVPASKVSRGRAAFPQDAFAPATKYSCLLGYALDCTPRACQLPPMLTSSCLDCMCFPALHPCLAPTGRRGSRGRPGPGGPAADCTWWP